MATITDTGHRNRLHSALLSHCHTSHNVIVLSQTQVLQLNLLPQTLSADSPGLVVSGVKVLCHRTGRLHDICPRAGGEVVLCAGALGTPRVLSTACVREGVREGEGGREEEEVSALPMNMFSTSSGCVLDHTILPLICVGNWWKVSGVVPIPRDGTTPGGSHPPNGVHGWVYLNEDGSLYNESPTTPPR